MHIRTLGHTVQLCRWQVSYKMDDADMVEYVPTEEEADELVEQFGGVKTPLDTVGFEWVDGITVPESSTMPKTDAEAIIARGKSAYLNSMTIPSVQTSMAAMMRDMLKAQPPEDTDGKIRVSGLYEDWSVGNYSVGDIRNANGQTWECIQAHDNAVYPDIAPDNAAWYTFWKPLHGKSPETARPWVKQQGVHDMYQTGEYMIYNGELYKCVESTNFNPDEYGQAWEVQD